MLIDWFTVGAQALNFLVLVWLMKRFLFKPILHAIDEREKRIAAKLEDAAAKQSEAQAERDEFKHKNDEFNQEREARLSQVADEADTERQRLLTDARTEAADLGAQRQAALNNEARSLSKAISQRTQEEVFAIARKALADLATTSLEERMVEVFVRRLRDMDGEAKTIFAKAISTSSGPAFVRSAFDLPSEQREAIQHALNETFSADVPIRFETAPDLVSGIELMTNGQRVAWSIAAYIATLEKGVAALLNDQKNSELPQ
jgi:F-type H+-transporting ATPase subunit b